MSSQHSSYLLFSSSTFGIGFLSSSPGRCIQCSGLSFLGLISSFSSLRFYIVTYWRYFWYYFHYHNTIFVYYTTLYAHNVAHLLMGYIFIFDLFLEQALCHGLFRVTPLSFSLIYLNASFLFEASTRAQSLSNVKILQFRHVHFASAVGYATFIDDFTYLLQQHYRKENDYYRHFINYLYF